MVNSNDGLRLTFDFLQLGQLRFPMYLYGENVEKSFTLNVLKKYV